MGSVEFISEFKVSLVKKKCTDLCLRLPNDRMFFYGAVDHIEGSICIFSA